MLFYKNDLSMLFKCSILSLILVNSCSTTISSKLISSMTSTLAERILGLFIAGMFIVLVLLSSISSSEVAILFIFTNLRHSSLFAFLMLVKLLCYISFVLITSFLFFDFFWFLLLEDFLFFLIYLSSSSR